MLHMVIAPIMFIAFCPAYPEKYRMGSHYVYAIDSLRNYQDAVDYCLNSHGASLPTISTLEDANHISLIAQIELGSE